MNDVGDLTAYVIPGQNGYIVNAENRPVGTCHGVGACHGVGTCHGMSLQNMRDACLNSMKPYDEILINSKIVKLILDCKPAI